MSSVLDKVVICLLKTNCESKTLYLSDKLSSGRSTKPIEMVWISKSRFVSYDPPNRNWFEVKGK